jgi:hypothetical protein
VNHDDVWKECRTTQIDHQTALPASQSRLLMSQIARLHLVSKKMQACLEAAALALGIKKNLV